MGALPLEAPAAPALPIPVAPALYRNTGLKVDTKKKHLTCNSCGKGVECSPGEPPCEVLKGWFTVSQWEGPGAVSHYYFCSLSCLKSWVSNRVPKVPQVFLKSFGEDESREDKE
jgi:hypothetical protein